MIACARLAAPFSLEGLGTHSGKPARLVVAPGGEGAGITFRRTDQAGAPTMQADWRAVRATRLQTVLGDPKAGGIATVEHLMAALAGLGVGDADVTLDGPEMPIMDGSAAPFVAAIRTAGLVPREGPVEVIRIRAPVRVDADDAWAELVPADAPAFDITIDFPEPVIGRQSIAFTLTPEIFAEDIAPARTFGRLRGLWKLRLMGYARGSSLANAVAIHRNGRTVLNPEGLRFPDEFVRHKALDAVGDLALAGRPILGLYRSFKGGHRLNHRMLAALFATPEAFEVATVA